MSHNKNFKKLVGSYFLSLGYSYYKNGWLKSTTFACPFCGREKLGVNPGSNFYHCFRCDSKGQLTDLIMEIENIYTYNELLKFLDGFKGGLYYSTYNGQIKERDKKEERTQENKILPDNFLLINQGTSELAKALRRYVKKRGFDIDKLSRKGWGYVTTGKYLGYLIMPYTKNHRVVYFNARNVMAPHGPRYLNPDNEDMENTKSTLLYNEEALDMYKSVYLCEGIINAETISDNRGICTAGKHLSKYQINLLIKKPVERIIICLDPDAMDKAFEIASMLIEHKLVKVLSFPDGKDINDIGRKEALRIAYSTSYLRSYNDILKYKHRIL